MPDIYFKDKAINLPGIRRILRKKGLRHVTVDSYPDPSDGWEQLIVIKNSPLGAGLRVYEDAIDRARKEYKKKRA